MIYDYPLAKASIDVRDAVDRTKARLPSTAEEPIVQEQNANDFPIIQVNLIGEDVPERVVYNVAVALRDDIEDAIRAQRSERPAAPKPAAKKAVTKDRKDQSQRDKR